ncbi:Trp biosynthesis-associated membrane protein [Nocardioides sp.]|uniref:Trp biosynthesis-associated membrane protein n=1 Tax=Nocardioides sp. TaxID=35761 RepID=UPI002607E0BF|nr:Trp biosynthesis-associated membrane protein [Nocardioides sp.]
MSRRSFWPTVGLGLIGAGAAAIAGHKPWVHAGSTKLTDATGGVVGERPDVTALALVAMAAWGVLLVTRGWVRRLLAVLATVAAAAATAFAVVGLTTTPDTEASWFSYTSDGPPALTHGSWGWIALVGAVVAVLAGLYALRATPSWPEMGRRYDAPVTAAAAEPETPLDWWKAMDEGRDPTADPAAPPATDQTGGAPGEDNH